MRTLRGALVGACALALIATGTPAHALPATPAAAPSAPYTALVLDGWQGSWSLAGTLSFDSGNATITSYTYPSTPGMDLMVHNASHDWDVSLAPPAGAAWTVGTTYPVLRYVDPSAAFFSVSGDGRGCDEQPGSLTVKEATTDTQGKLTAFAASFTVGCENPTPTLSGEIRWNSSVGYAGATTSAASVDFGSQQAGSPGAQKTVTFTSTGSQPVSFGAASLTGTDPTAFAITANTCSSTSLAYGETCTVSVTANPTAAGAQSAYLKLADDTVSGQKYVALSETGADPRSVALSSDSLDFGRQDVAFNGAPKKLTITANGILPITFGTASIGGGAKGSYSITADTCSNATVNVGSSCAISVTPHPTASGYNTASLVIPDNSYTPKAIPLYSNAIVGAPGTYYPLAPTRILDTRSGLGAARKAVGPGAVLHLQVSGRGGVPGSGVAAVVLNVTVVNPSAGGYLTVYPDGVSRPTASSLNFPKGWVGANSVTVTLGSGGKVAIYNSSGSTQIVADVVGYFGKDDSLIDQGFSVGGQLQPTRPQRILDTRSWGSKLPAGFYVDIPVDYGASVNPHIRALVVNVTAVSPSASGYLTAWNGIGSDLQLSSTLNYTTGAVVPNLAVVPTAACQDCGTASGLPSIGVYTSSATHVLVDIVGFFDDGTLPNGLRFQALTPTRIADSRTGLGIPHAIGPDSTATVTAPASVLTPGRDTQALALNVTAVAPSAGTYLTVWPDGITGIGKPGISNLNPRQGQVVPNAVVTLIGPADAFNIYNSAGTTNVVVDVVGSYYLYPGTASAGISAAARSAHAKVLPPTMRRAG